MCSSDLWDGTKDNTAADEYATESHVWDVTQLFGTKDGGTDGHYYRFAKEGMRGVSRANAFDAVELVNGEGYSSIKDIVWSSLSNWTTRSIGGATQFYCPINDRKNGQFSMLCDKLPTTPNSYCDYRSEDSIAGSASSKNVFFKVGGCTTTSQLVTWLNANAHGVYALATPLTFTSLFLSASSTADELTAMPADAIPLSEIQFADNNWSIEEAIYDAPEADANGVITPTAVTGQMRIQYSLDAAEQIDTLQKEYAALEARVSALEGA